MSVNKQIEDPGLIGFREYKKNLEGVRIPYWIHARIPIVALATVQTTTLVLDKYTKIHDVMLNVKTAEATGGTKTVDIGISGGDEDGFLDGASVASAGEIKGTLASGGQTRGALIRVDESGSGGLVPEVYVCAAATTICYTLGSNDFAELDAEERLLLKLRFADGLTIVAIAGLLAVPPKPLYGRLERTLAGVRRRLEREGLEASQVLGLLGWPGLDLAIEFGAEAREDAPRPSQSQEVRL